MYCSAPPGGKCLIVGRYGELQQGRWQTGGVQMPVQVQRTITVEQLALAVAVQHDMHPIRRPTVAFAFVQQAQKVIGDRGIKPVRRRCCLRQVQPHHWWAAVGLGARWRDVCTEGCENAPH